MIISRAQYTITDVSDPIISSTAPPAPIKDALWLDTSVTPNVLKRWDGTTWQSVSDYEIGGRNLLLKSNVKTTNKGYPLKIWDIGNEKPIEGETYTFTMKGQLGDEKSFFGIYNSGGSVWLAILKNLGNGLYGATFKWIIKSGSNTASNTTVHLYPVPHNVTTESTVEWAKLERGNKATDWTPAPEDVDDAIDKVDKVTKTNSTNITAANGRIDVLISENTTRKGETTELNTKYSQMEGTVDGLAITVGNVASKTNENERQISLVKDKQAQFDVTVDGIKGTVHDTTELVGETATAVASLSSTVSQQADKWTAAFKTIGVDGYAKTGKTTIDANGLTIFDGALTVKNAAGNDILKANQKGYLDLVGNFTQYADNGNESIVLKNNSVGVYAFGEKNESWNSGQYLGSLKPSYFKLQNYPVDYALQLFSEHILLLGVDDKEQTGGIIIKNYPTGVSKGNGIAYSSIDFFVSSVTCKGNESDIISEQGTYGIWTYRKWLSGLSECWGVYDLRVTNWVAWGNIYESVNQSPHIYFPPGLFNAGITFYSPSAIQGVRSDGVNYATAGVELSSDYALNHTGKVQVLRGTPDDGKGTYEIHFEIKGRWK